MTMKKTYKTIGTFITAILTVCTLTSCGQEVEVSEDSSRAEISVSADSAEEITETGTAEVSSEETTEIITEALTEITTGATTDNITEIPTQETTDTTVGNVDYKTAYLDFIESAEDSAELYYNLIYFNEDDVPELVTGKNGFFVSMYTYVDGEIYTLMDQWSYGAMGIAGYEYVPKMNSIKKDDSDWAGLIRFTAYYSMNDEYTLETTTIVETRLFEDTNGNGFPDSEEYIPDYYVYLVDGEEISYDEAVSYDVGEYEFIGAEKTLDEIKAQLS